MKRRLLDNAKWFSRRSGISRLSKPKSGTITVVIVLQIILTSKYLGNSF